MKYIRKSLLAIGGTLIISTLFGIVWFSNAFAASGNNFNAGRIIDDAVFYNSSSMSASNIQKFLESKVPNCDYNGTQSAADWGYPNITHAQLAEYKRNGSNGFSKDTGFHAPPYKCLTKYTQKTPQMEAASGYCSAISAGTRSAAQIIKDVSSACGINPQVLIVLLEKEQSLVTDNWPLNRQLRSATGFACPDTAPCDPDYEGFFYQVYNAARQFKVYKAYPNNYNYVAGRKNKIYWQTNLGNWENSSGNYNSKKSNCGYSNVYIQNQATAALYVYTPYRPNQKALANLYGTGDNCSAYGNRNFWRIFTDWFGSTIFTVRGAIGEKYNSLGGLAGTLGQPLINERCGLIQKGCYQAFEHGSIYWTEKTGAYAVWGGVKARWSQHSNEKGPLGYPISDEICGLVGGGCYQRFQYGRIYWTESTGGQPVWGGIKEKYTELKSENGFLGYPTANESCGLASGGCYQQFQNGRIYWTESTKAQSIHGAIGEKFLALGAQTGTLKYPTSGEICASGSCYQQFQNGRIYWSEATTALPVWGAIGGKYVKIPSGSTIGLPTANESCGLASSGCYQQFQSGRIYWSNASGAHVVKSTIYTRYLALGGETSTLKYPKGDEVCGIKNNGCYQLFQNGRIYWSSQTGSHAIWGAIKDKYVQLGSEWGELGYPTSDEIYTTAHTYQQFESGTIYWTSTQGAWVD